MSLCIGIDLGTSGCRAVAMDSGDSLVAVASKSLPDPLHDVLGIHQDPKLWWQAVVAVLGKLSEGLKGRTVDRLAVNGTSATLLVCDPDGNPLMPAFMYNDQRPQQYAQAITDMAPVNSAAHGASSSLSKYLWFRDHVESASYLVMHQADWVLGKLTGRWGYSDYNNCLKLGYDPVLLGWPDWLEHSAVETERFPRVLAPGAVIGQISSSVAQNCSLSKKTLVTTGTTDSVAAFIAAGAKSIGDGVTSLGSTLVIKLLSDKPVFAPEFGIYSHRLGDTWLVGGASNSGGAVLKKYFTQQDIDRMTPGLKPEQKTGLDYYPLCRPGERFPVNDPEKQPRMMPTASSDLELFQAMLEGIAYIEAEGYRKLEELGAARVKSIRTSGGGAKNSAWTEIRKQQFDKAVEFAQAKYTDAACGTALLACSEVGSRGPDD